jgi:hypothetical protein
MTTPLVTVPANPAKHQGPMIMPQVDSPVYGTIRSGVGGCRPRPTATEPATRWMAEDELPTTITTNAPGFASRMPAAAAVSS